MGGFQDETHFLLGGLLSERVICWSPAKQKSINLQLKGGIYMLPDSANNL